MGNDAGCVWPLHCVTAFESFASMYLHAPACMSFLNFASSALVYGHTPPSLLTYWLRSGSSVLVLVGCSVAVATELAALTGAAPLPTDTAGADSRSGPGILTLSGDAQGQAMCESGAESAKPRMAVLPPHMCWPDSFAGAASVRQQDGLAVSVRLSGAQGHGCACVRCVP